MIPLLPCCALSLLCSPDLHCCVSYQDVTMAESFWLLPFIYTIIALVARGARGSSPSAAALLTCGIAAVKATQRDVTQRILGILDEYTKAAASGL